jgi:hypothetical protein
LWLFLVISFFVVFLFRGCGFDPLAMRPELFVESCGC